MAAFTSDDLTSPAGWMAPTICSEEVFWEALVPLPEGTSAPQQEHFKELGLLEKDESKGSQLSCMWDFH